MTTTHRYYADADRSYFSWQGDRYEQHFEHEMCGDGCEYSDGPFDTVEEAREWVSREVSRHEVDAYEIIPARHGLSTVSFWCFRITRFVEDDETGDLEFDETFDSEGADTLPEGVERAMREAERSAWRYLDYESDGFCDVRDFLEM